MFSFCPTESDQTGVITGLEKIINWPFDVPKFTRMWRIDNLNSYIRRSCCIKSPTFFIELATGKLECKLEMTSDRRNVSFDISSPNLTEIYCQISILNDRNEKCFTRNIKPNRLRCAPYISWDFLEKENKEKPFGSSLTILCEFPIFTDEINLQTQFDNIEIPKCSFQEEISQLFEEIKFCDAVILSANGEEFRVHKAILAVRSPVFAAMFEHDMLENKFNRVEIADVEHTVLKEMLRYIYTDKVKNLKTVAYDLLVAANKYQLLRLKDLCVKELSNNLTVDNVADILILSEKHSVDKLKILAIDFIIHHMETVVPSPGWKNILTSYSNLVNEIILKLNKYVVFK